MGTARGGADDLVGRIESLRVEIRRARAEAEARSRAGSRRRVVGTLLRRAAAAVVLLALLLVGMVLGVATSRGGSRSSGDMTAPGPPTTAAPGPSPVRPGPEVPAPAPPPRAGPEAGGAPATWTVAPGDSFWAVAEQVVRRGGTGRRAGADEVGRYWARLVAANASRLPVPGDADLIYPGTVLRLPAE